MSSSQADQWTPSHLYKALVLPKLDYCSSMWDLHTITLSDRLESIQRFASRLCTRPPLTYSPHLIGPHSTPANPDRRRFSVELSETSRSSNRFLTSIPRLILTLALVTVPYGGTTFFQSSFFISSCRLWNGLPDSGHSNLCSII